MYFGLVISIQHWIQLFMHILIVNSVMHSNERLRYDTNWKCFLNRIVLFENETKWKKKPIIFWTFFFSVNWINLYFMKKFSLLTVLYLCVNLDSLYLDRFSWIERKEFLKKNCDCPPSFPCILNQKKKIIPKKKINIDLCVTHFRIIFRSHFIYYYL